MTKVLFGILCIGILFSCNKKYKHISEDRAALVFADIALADQIINQYRPEDRDSVRNLLMQSLLKIHNLTEAELDTNLYIYMSDMSKFGRLTDLMISRYDSLSKVSED